MAMRPADQEPIVVCVEETWLTKLQVPFARYETLPPSFTRQIDGVDEVTEAVPVDAPLLITGVNEPPGAAELGMSEIVSWIVKLCNAPSTAGTTSLIWLLPLAT
jgi:hypothetical protein